MRLERALSKLDEIKRGSNLKSPHLTEAQVELLLTGENGVFEALGFTGDKLECQGSDGAKGIPDALLHVSKSCIIPIDAKKGGKLAGTRRNYHLIKKARYVREINLKLHPKSRGAGFGMLLDGETWILFEVEPLENRLVEFDYVRVLLQFEATTSRTEKLLEQIIARTRTKESAPKRVELQRALELVKHQEALTKAVLPRLTPRQMLPFFEFLSCAHGRLDWEQFDQRMNRKLSERRAFFLKHCGASPEDLAVADAIYGSARFAAELMKHIIPSKTHKLWHVAPNEDEAPSSEDEEDDD